MRYEESEQEPLDDGMQIKQATPSSKFNNQNLWRTPMTAPN
jgi:hypothetical protein